MSTCDIDYNSVTVVHLGFITHFWQKSIDIKTPIHYHDFRLGENVIITIANQKGAWQTTTSINLAAALP
jgi:hypothetical protein